MGEIWNRAKLQKIILDHGSRPASVFARQAAGLGRDDDELGKSLWRGRIEPALEAVEEPASARLLENVEM